MVLIGSGRFAWVLLVLHAACCHMTTATCHAQEPARLETRRVLLVILTDPIDQEALRSHPGIQKLSAMGVRFDKVHAAAKTPEEAALQVLTGATSDMPSAFEYLRKGRKWEGWQTWLLTSGSRSTALRSGSAHAEFGTRFHARRLNLSPVFSSTLFTRGLRVDTIPPDMERARARLDGPPTKGKERRRMPPSMRQDLERELLAELSADRERPRPANESRAALLCAATLLENLEEGLVVAVLGQTSRTDAVASRRAMDATLSTLEVAWSRVTGSERSRQGAALFIVPGRAVLEPRARAGGARRRDRFKSTSLIAIAPEFRRGKVVTSGARTTEVCAAVCRLMGVKTVLPRAGFLKAAWR